MIEVVGAICAAVSVAGVICNNRKMAVCFWLWMVSNLISAALHVQTELYSLSVRDLVFFALAIEGLIIWRRKK